MIVTATLANTGPTGYVDVGDAFAAINAGTHQGAINISIICDTIEPVSAVLNASGTGSSSYTSVLMTPVGVRTVAGALAAPLIDLNGADIVTINGLNAAGNSLTLCNSSAAATAGTSTIRFIEGATNDVVTNCSVLGSSTGAVGVATGNVLFSTSTVAGGNSSNTISLNDIGPCATLPTKGGHGAWIGRSKRQHAERH